MKNDSLESIPGAMACAVRPMLASIDRAGYVRFLDAMVHYTRGSGERLEHAAAHAPTAAMRDFFAQLAREESGHFRLAEADLDALGERVSESAPRGVGEFHRWWMESRDAATWLGALYALENVAGHLAGDVPPQLARLGLERTQVRFVAMHLQADEAHGSLTAEHAAGLGESELVEAAKRAAAFWVALHRDAFAGH
ncbi:MAG: hypothetical protein JWM10_5300 [Myxococcaceae bacterium]|nr:hypothetical protein [Myxococcaceae bacterium]